MNQSCRCRFCVDHTIQFWRVSDSELIELVSTTDARHRLARVSAYVELFYRAGIFTPAMPYIVWRYVMGPQIPPPVSSSGFGAFSSRHVMPQHDCHVHH